MQTIELAYLMASIAGIMAMTPQIKQLLTTKQSDELNLITWAVWGFSQIVALFYSLTIGAIPYVITNIAWVTFYVVMIVLIIKYRKNTPTLASQPVKTDESSLPNLKLQNEH